MSDAWHLTPGTMFAKNKGESLVHGSGSAASAEREIKFALNEIVG